MNAVSETFIRDKTISVVDRIVRQIALREELVEVQDATIGLLTLISVRVGRGDTKRIHGHAGAHSKALSRLLKMISYRTRAAFNIEFLEPTRGEDDRYPRFELNPDWNSTEVLQLLTDICGLVLTGMVEIRQIEDPASPANTTLDIVADDTEEENRMLRLRDVLAPLFTAIGNANGRKLAVNIESSVNYQSK